MAEGPTLLLVHGAWSGGWAWDPVLGPLRERGVPVEVIEQLPSAEIDADELGDLCADVEHVRARLDGLPAPVVLCGHSYGGIVITELADHPAIGHSVYLTAFWPGQDQSLNDLATGGPPTGSSTAATAVSPLPTTSIGPPPSAVHGSGRRSRSARA